MRFVKATKNISQAIPKQPKNKQRKIRSGLEQNEIRDAAIAAGPAAYREYLRLRSNYQNTERPDRVLILVPPKLLDRFQQLCNEESYTFNEGVREAMRRMMVELQENEIIKNETPERQQDSFEKLTKSLSRILKEEDPSILPSGIQGVL